MAESTLTERIAARAKDLGLDLFGVCEAAPVAGWDHFEEWAREGMAGEMAWLVKEPLKRSDPRRVMPGCRSVIAAGMIYRTSEDAEEVKDEALYGQVARYARGDDYHEVLKDRLDRLLGAIREEAGVPVEGRVYVDTGPLLERDLAYAAGLGWRAKNTHLIHPRLGSYFFLGEILLDLPLMASTEQPDRCGTCTRCLDSCPTAAFVGPGVLDARRCISYLTIELRGPIPRSLRPLIGNMVFGCDICQEVCPWNRKAPLSMEPAFKSREGLQPADLVELLLMTQEEFSTRFRGSAIKRTKRRGLARNAAVALGNSGDLRAVAPLCNAMQDPEPLVRGHAAWALGRLGGQVAQTALQSHLPGETDTWVREEVTLALSEITGVG